MPDRSKYVVVLRSRSGCRVRKDSYIDVNISDGRSSQAQVRISTRWEDLGLQFPLPREMWIAVTVHAADIDVAVVTATRVASSVAAVISFCVNASVEPPALHLAFNADSGLSRREFMEAFRPDESGHPRPGRWIDANNLYAFGLAVYASAEAPRIFRALAQYQTALRFWNTGSRVLVLAHLYIACEALTKATLRFHEARLRITPQHHAQLLGVDTAQSDWRMTAANFARRDYIFEGDKALYQAAKKARNKFEHGTADLGEVRQTADEITREVFDLVRSAILQVLPGLNRPISDSIMSKAPIDVSPFHKLITGYIVSDQPSDPANLGRPGELFPALRWRSDIRSSRLDGDNLNFDLTESATVEFADGLRFEGRGYAIYGGLNPAPAGAQADSQVPSVWHQRPLEAGSKGLRILKRDGCALPPGVPLPGTAGRGPPPATVGRLPARS